MSDQIGRVFVKIEADVSSLRSELNSMKNQLSEQKQGFESLGSVAKTVFGSVIVRAAAQAAMELVKIGAESERIGNSFEIMQGGAEDAARGLESLRDASRGTIADTELMLAANRAQLLGVAQNAEDLTGIMEIAAIRGRAMGLDTATAFDNIVTGIGRESRLILDNLGIIIDIEAATADYATSVGKAKDELTAFERKQAIVAEINASSAGLLRDQGDVALDTAGKIEQVGAAWANLKSEIGVGLGEGLEQSGAVKFLDNLTAYFADVRTGKNTIADFRDSLKQLNEEGKLSDLGYLSSRTALAALAGEWRSGQIETDTLAEKLRELNPAAMDMAEGIRTAAEQATVDLHALAVAGDATKAMGGGTADFRLATSGNDAELIQEQANARAEAADELRQQQADLQAELEEMATDHARNMQDIEWEGLAALQQGDIDYQMQLVQAQAQYQGQRQALLEQGKTDEVAKLDEKYQTELKQMEGQHKTEQLMQERNILLQRRDALLGYLQDLADHGKFSVDKLNSMKNEALGEFSLQNEKGSGIYKLTTAWNKADLEADKAKYVEQINAQKAHSVASIRMYESLRENAATGSAGAAEAAFAAIQADLQANLQATLDSLSSTYSSSGYASAVGSGVSAGAKGASEKATASVQTMVSDINKAIKEAKEAIAEVLSIELPEGIDEGFEKFGESTKKAVTKMYDVVMGEGDIKGKIKKLTDYMEPLKALLAVYSTQLQVEPVKDDDMANLDKLKWQYVEMVQSLDSLVNILEESIVGEDEDPKEVLTDLRDKVALIKSGLELYSVDLSKAVPVKFGFTEKIKGFAAQVKEGILELHDMVKSLSLQVRTQLADSAGVLKDATSMFGILGAFDKLPDMAAVTKFRLSSKTYFEVWRTTRDEITDELGSMSEEEKDQIAAAAEVSTLMEDLFSGIFFDFSSLRSPARTYKQQLSENLAALELTTDAAVPVFERIQERWGASFETVTATLDFVQGVFGGIKDIAQSISDAVELGGIDVGSALALFEQFSAIFDPITGAIQASLPGTDATAGGVPSWAMPTPEGAMGQAPQFYLTVNFDGNSVTEAIDMMDESSRYALANTLAEILYAASGSMGAARG